MKKHELFKNLFISMCLLINLGFSAFSNANVSQQLPINALVIDTSKPQLLQVTAVNTPSNNKTPSYTFSSTEAGAISYFGSCKSSTLTAVDGFNTVVFNSLPAGRYSDCKIRVTDTAGNVSTLLTINAFTISKKPPVILSMSPSVLIVGNEVTLTGSFFSLSTIELNGSLIPTTSVTENIIRFNATSLPAGEYILDVINPFGKTSKTVSIVSPLVAQKIDAGGWSHCALKVTDNVNSSGSVYCWGSNEYGQLGNDTLVNSTLPVLVKGITKAVAVSAGIYHSCAVVLSGTKRIVQCWGDNSSGQLGDSSYTDSEIPVTVSGITNALSVSVGFNYTCANLTNATVKCWGYNAYGQLGNGTVNDNTLPVLVSGLNNVKDLTVSVGGSHSCALLSDGTAKCWGRNSSGQLGNNTKVNSNVPVSVKNINTATAISAGTEHTCFLLSSGKVNCLGANNFSQLGNNSTVDSQLIVAVSGIKIATSLSTSYDHSCAVLSNSSVKCWGLRYFGLFGTNANVQSKIPLSVGGLSNASTISTGFEHTCAILKNGQVKCWGYGNSGQLGNGATNFSAIPVAAGDAVE